MYTTLEFNTETACFCRLTGYSQPFSQLTGLDIQYLSHFCIITGFKYSTIKYQVPFRAVSDITKAVKSDIEAVKLKRLNFNMAMVV